MPAPDLTTVPHFYHRYIEQVTASNAAAATTGHLQGLINQLQNLEEEEWNYAYSEGKWTIKEVTQHVIDAERIFCHRALSIAREDDNPLPGFDEDSYAAASAANSRTGSSLLEELHALAASTRCLFGSFNDRQIAATGAANNKPISVNAIAYIIAGHALHHTQVVKERYLDKSYVHAVPA